MKVEVQQEVASFRPLVVTFTIESPDEVRVLLEVFGNNVKLGQTVGRSDSDRILIASLLGNLYNGIREKS